MNINELIEAVVDGEDAETLLEGISRVTWDLPASSSDMEKLFKIMDKVTDYSRMPYKDEVSSRWAKFSDRNDALRFVKLLKSEMPVFYKNNNPVVQYR